MSFAEFDQSIDELYGQSFDELEASNIRYRLARYFEELAHCEFDYRKRRIYCCRPELVLLPGRGCFSAFLAGARIPSMLKKLQEFKDSYKEEIEISMLQMDRLGIPLPERFCISVIRKELLKQISRELNINFNGDSPAAWLLLNTTVDLIEYENSLNKVVYGDLNWSRRVFSRDDMYFINNPSQDSNGLIEYRDPISQKKYYLWNIDGVAAEVDRDWGRYLALRDCKKPVLIYDKEKHILGTPSTTPLPRMIARAATLCSGYPMEQVRIKPDEKSQSTIKYDIYYGVPQKMAIIISNKVSQHLYSYKFEVSGEGIGL
jgi:hypothetical protein